MTTTDVVQMPLVVVVLPVLGDEALVDQAGHVGLERVVHVVGLLAGHDGAALVAGGAVRALELDVLAGVGVLEGVEDALVGRLEDREAHDVDRSRQRLPDESPEHPVKASTPAAETAAATLIVLFIAFSFLAPHPVPLPAPHRSRFW